ncbi:MAG: hydantoinase B/oxoprolinase family protein [Desulfomonilaceae bacterium]|nr:hydantoinase B/oxoprolinase family protein [Desulfomonilaceae bacterium]
MEYHEHNPITLEVFGNLFSSIAEEMGTALCRAALSPNIKERRDFSCVVCDEKGELIAQAAHIPVHLGSAPLSVQEALSAVVMKPGDIVLLNDPFKGGTHLPDLTMVSPVFLDPSDTSAAFFIANRAHHADVGGIAAGSMPVSDEIYQEGLIIPPLRLVKEGEMDRDILALILRNVRTPLEREGDIQAQVASLHIGIKRLIETTRRYDADMMRMYAAALKDRSEKMLRSVLAAIPDGDYVGEDYLDDDGFRDEPIPIRVVLRIRGDAAEADFSGSAPQVKGNLNAVKAITVSAVLYVFRLLVPEDIPANSGTLRPLNIIVPEGSILNAVPPAAVAGGNVETSQRVVDVLLAALAQAIPWKIPAASQGTMNNLTIGAAHPDPSLSFAYYETVGGGAGAGPSGAGASGIHSHMTNTMNTPVEALEASYPLLVEKFRLRRDSGGRGKHAGGEGICRDIRILRPARVAMITERRKIPPYGLAGGSPGKTGKNVVIRADGSRVELPSKVSFHAEPGDVVSMCTPGGGGWGSESDHES